MRNTLLILLLMLLAAPARAMTFVPMPDGELLWQADTVVYGEILAADASDGESTGYQLQVLDGIKGAAAGAVMDLHVPGVADARRGGRVVPGAPHFAAGERVLLFLNPAAGGRHALTQFALGAFRERPAGDGSRVLVRDLSAAYELGSDTRSPLLPAENGLRDATRFRDWLRGQSRGRWSEPSYWSAPATTVSKDEFTTLDNPPGRWFQFDSNSNVSVRAHQTGQTGLSGGGYSQFQAGISAWNNDAGSNVRYVYGGTTAASGGLNNSDGVNAILFNDPNNEIGGSYDCTNGGVLAMGGYFSTGERRSFNGSSFVVIVEGDIVIQNNAGCFLNGLGATNAAEVFAHELGHTLGLGHSCEGTLLSPCAAGTAVNDALMRAFPHEDRRGAALRSDDRAGIAFLYASSGGNTPPPTSGSSGGGGGGCSLGTAGRPDPLLPLLAVLAALALAARRRHHAR